jgi:hypothetical protein
MKVLNSDDSSSISAIYQFFSFASTEYKINKTIEVDKRHPLLLFTDAVSVLIGCHRSTCYQSRYGAQYSDDYLYDLAPATW